MPHHSGYLRHPDDFYVEDDWCFDALPAILGAGDFTHVYDPACGIGTIPIAAQRLGLRAAGTDLVDRPKIGPFPFKTRDFISERTHVRWPCVVMNPPFRQAREFIEKALVETQPGGVVAALAPLSFLVSQERYDFFQRPEVERIIFLSKRPSMPDGDMLLAGKLKRGGGQEVYAWLVLRAGGRTGRACVAAHWWMPPVVKLTSTAAPRRLRKPAAQLELPLGSDTGAEGVTKRPNG